MTFARISIVFLTLITFLGCTTSSMHDNRRQPSSEILDLGSTQHFPYAYPPDTKGASYLQFRAEGRSFGESLRKGLSYVRKYQFKKFSTTDEEVQYFNDQRALWKYLSQAPVSSAEKNAGSVSLGMVGDIMWVRDQWSTFVQQDVKDYLARFDVLLGNLETPISKSNKVPSFLFDYAKYNSDPALVTTFAKKDGSNLFTAVSTANNHTLDQDDLGAAETMAFLDQQKILHSGVAQKGAKKFTTFEKNGIKFGFYAATWGVNDPSKKATSSLQINYLNGLAPLNPGAIDLSEVQDILKDMEREGVQFKIVSIHWGYEYELYPDPIVMQTGRQIVALGADLIIGSHPHVQQPFEVCFVNGYEEKDEFKKLNLLATQRNSGCVVKTSDRIARKGLIVYSLGNFASTMYTDLCKIGLIQSIEVYKEGSHTDWRLPKSQFVYNKIGRNRSLKMVHKPEDVPKSDREALEYLRNHLGIP